MRYTVDRIEGSFAVCEDSSGTMVDIQIDKLPNGVRSGDVLVLSGGRYFSDKAASDERRTAISALQKKVLAKCTKNKGNGTH